MLFSHNTGKALNASKTDGVSLTYITTSNVYWNSFELDNLKIMPFTDSETEKRTVKKGDLLLKFDLDLVKEKGYSTETMMSFELGEGRTLQMQYTGETQGKDIIAVVK